MMQSRVKNREVIFQTLSDLNGPKQKGQKIDNYWFHPFPARMPLSVATHILYNATLPGATILDPMVGSGTTLFAASKIGLPAFGFDKDPLSVIISKSLLGKYNSERLESLRKRVLENASSILSKKEAKKILQKFKREDSEFIEYWYPNNSIKQLYALREAIESETNDTEKALAWSVFSSLIIAKTAGASYAIDIPRSRPHKKPGKNIVLPFEAWNKRFMVALKKLPYIDMQPDAKCIVKRGDARQLPVDGETIDLVLTSPPYCNSIDYIRSHKFSLIWMGYKIFELREVRGTMVGSERGLWTKDGLPSIIENKLIDSVNENRKRAHLRRYLSDLRMVFAEVQRVLKPNGLAFIVVGPTIINKRKTDAAEIISEIGTSTGLKYFGSAVRKLNPDRRSLPLPRPSKDLALSKRMRREVILAFEK